jgi:hypothetical protein
VGPTQAVRANRVVNACGGISIAGRQISVGMPLAGQRIRVRLEGILLHVTDEAGQLRRTLRCPLPPTACGRIRDARPASPVPPPATAPSVERVVSVTGSILASVRALVEIFDEARRTPNDWQNGARLSNLLRERLNALDPPALTPSGYWQDWLTELFV